MNQMNVLRLWDQRDFSYSCSDIDLQYIWVIITDTLERSLKKHLKFNEYLNLWASFEEITSNSAYDNLLFLTSMTAAQNCLFSVISDQQ